MSVDDCAYVIVLIRVLYTHILEKCLVSLHCLAFLVDPFGLLLQNSQLLLFSRYLLHFSIIFIGKFNNIIVRLLDLFLIHIKKSAERNQRILNLPVLLPQSFLLLSERQLLLRKLSFLRLISLLVLIHRPPLLQQFRRWRNRLRLLARSNNLARLGSSSSQLLHFELLI